MKYVGNYRLSQAKNLLLNSGLGLDRVAELCGFENKSYFIAKFRRSFSVTPGEYRRTANP